MYDLKRTQARTAFKDLLGQANHFLITILIGLNGVRSGKVGHDMEFHAAWNPQDVKASVDRSRAFALDLALVRAVDALDAFMMISRRAPSTLGSSAFESEMDGTGRSVLERLNVFLRRVTTVPSEHASFMRLAIGWRNKKVHLLADVELSSDDERTLVRSSAALANEFRGLSIDQVLARFQAADSPHFKDAASIIALAHKLVERFDEHLLQTMDIEEYIRISLRNFIAISASRSEEEQIKHGVRRIWGSSNREAKAIRALRSIGVHEVANSKGRHVPDENIERLLRFSAEDAIRYFLSKPA